MSKLTQLRILKVSLTVWFITWFILDAQIGYLLTAPYSSAMGSLPTKAKR